MQTTKREKILLALGGLDWLSTGQIVARCGYHSRGAAQKLLASMEAAGEIEKRFGHHEATGKVCTQWRKTP